MRRIELGSFRWITVIALLTAGGLAPRAQAQTSSAPTEKQTPVTPPPRSPGRLSGLVFADWFANVQGSATPDSVNGFRIRRIYFGYDNDLDTSYAVRLLLEADGVELTSGGRVTEFVKQAYLERKHLGSFGSLFLGIAPTPLFLTAERLWGYRSVEKTILDLNGLASATDLGVSLLSPPTDRRPLGWHVMYANGSGTRPETDRGKRTTVAIPLKVSSVLLEGVADYEGAPGDHDRYMLKVLGGWSSERFGFGVEAFRLVRKNSGPAGDDVAPTGLSVFGRGQSGRWAALARFDHFDPDAEHEDLGYTTTLVIGGVDYGVTPAIHVIPNLEVRSYDAKSDALPELETDVVARVTLFFVFP